MVLRLSLQRINFRVLIVVLLHAFAALLFGATARGDVLSLTDGRSFEGELVEESRDGVRFRTQIHGIWTTLTIPRRLVYSVDPYEGDQSDLSAREASAADSAPVRAMKKDAKVIVVIPLSGDVGRIPGRSRSGECFTADAIEACFRRAEHLEADLIVLDIQSPGGRVDEMERICDVIQASAGKLPIVAFPGEAFSAAAIITMSCRDIIVRPDSRIGAAVIIQTGPEGVSAVDAKMASPHYARQRQLMRKSGHPYEIVQAMTIQEKELWWSPGEGLTDIEPHQDFADLWDHVDDEKSVLTMTAEQALQWDVALDSVGSVEGVARAMGISGQLDVVELQSVIRQHNEDFDRKLQAMVRQINDYFQSLIDMIQTLNDMTRAINEGNGKLAKRYRSQLNRDVSRADRARGLIERIDDGLVRHKFGATDSLIERLRDDREAFREMQSLIQRDNLQDYNRAIARFNAILAAWQKLITGA